MQTMKIKPPARSVTGPYVFNTLPVGSASQADRLGFIFWVIRE
jgi:hypothetical protein